MKREIKRVRFVVIAMLLFCGMAMQTRAANAGLTSSGTLLALSQHEVPGRAQRTLTLEERVSYQRAIEEVYWRHRIWPKERRDPKPSLDAVMSQAQLEKKVRDYLRNSQVLADYWQRPITTEQLQAEMDRMAQNTKQPEVLQELFEALGNDPFVIAECLARPVLAERLLAHPEFERVKQQSRTFDQTVAAGANYTLPAISDPSGGCIEDTWTPTNLTGTPDARVSHTAVWTGSEMIVWGGSGGVGEINTGGLYNPSTDSWAATSTTNAPEARVYHTAVWTGSEMIVWGGENINLFAFYNTGGKYNPVTDSWTATSTTNAPDGRSFHTAVWTGSEMIVWGGFAGGPFFNTGGRYNPNTNSWTATSTANAPTPRNSHTAVWTGTQMIVWGGEGENLVPLNTGGRYDPNTNSWTATSTANAPDGRSFPTAVWTGSEMIVWGGNVNTGGRYCVPSGPPPTPTPSPPPTPTPTPTPSPTPAPTPCTGGCAVTNTNDSGPGSLRQALAVAHDGDRITFAVSGTITLTSGGLGVNKNVTISGPGANQLAVDGNQGIRVFGIPPLRTVSISGLSIRNAQYGISNNQGTVSVSNCVLNGHSAAGLYNYAGQGSDGAFMTVANSVISNNSNIGALNVFPFQFSGGSGCACMTITDSVVSNNNADGISNAGHAVSGTATLTVVNSNVSDNDGVGIGNDANEGFTTASIDSTTVSGNSAGGVLTIAGEPLVGFGQLTITNSTISGNLSGNSGGGIHAGGIFAVSIVNSTISGNSSGDSGGGIFASGFAINALGDLSIVNSTITGNSAGTSGGGIYNVRTSLHVANSTITGNSAGSGGGIYTSQFGAALRTANTIFNAGASGENIFNDGGTVISDGYNLSSDDGGGYLNGAGDQINTDPLLGPLRDNGGPTFTHALSPHSPAIDAGDPSFTPPPSYDQRDSPFVRVFDGRIDIGSFEAQPRHPTPHPRPTPH